MSRQAGGARLMHRIIWIAAAIGFVLWSLLAWFGYAMLGWARDFAMVNADRLTVSEFADGLLLAADLLGTAGGTAIVFLWLFGTALIAAIAFAVSWLVRRYGGSDHPRIEVLR